MYSSFRNLSWFLAVCHLGVASLSFEELAPFDEHSNSTLFRRVRTPGGSGLPAVQTVQSIFSTGVSGNPGVCTAGQLAILNNWLIEVLELHDAAITAYSNAHTGDLGSAMLLTFLLGVKWSGSGKPSSTTKDLDDTIAERLDAVSQFLAGAGLEHPKTAEPPYLFCGDAFATLVDPNQPVMDSNGARIPILDNNQQTTGFETVADLFPSVNFGPFSKAFWVEQFKAYVFDSTGADTLCGKPSVQAATVNQRTLFQSNDPNIVTGVYDAFTAMCLASFTASTGSHSANSLDNAITYSGYPTAGVGPGLDTYVPYSATLYHELYHLTEGFSPTGDPYVSLQSILAAAATAGNRRDPSTTLIPTNPESFTQFAVAAYIYQNPPTAPAGSPAKPAVVFPGGIPRTVAGLMQPPGGNIP